MAKAKKKATKKAAKPKVDPAVAAERAKWEKARAEVKARPGPPARLVKLPKDWDKFGDEDRRQLIRKLRVECQLWEERLDSLRHQDNPNLWMRVHDLVEQAYGDLVQVRSHGNVWMALGSMERMFEIDPVHEKVDELQARVNRLIASVLNIGVGVRIGFEEGEVLGECCPDCGGTAVVCDE